MQATDVLSTEDRDQKFQEIKQNGENNKCVDCEKKNTKWATIDLGLFLCIDCAGRHRQYGPSLSLVKSLTLDSWTRKQIVFMENGGNSKFIDYLSKNGMIILGQHREIDYQNQTVKKYKAQQRTLIDQILIRDNLVHTVQSQNGPNQTSQSQKQEPKIQQSQQQQVVIEEKKENDFFQNNLKDTKKGVSSQKVVFSNSEAANKKTANKKMKAQKIDEIDFDNLVFDDGVKEQQKQNQSTAMVNTDFKLYEEEFPQTQKQSEPFTKQSVQQSEQNNQLMNHFKQDNVKSISSNSFFNDKQNIQQDKQAYNKFQGAQSISSKAFFGGPQDQYEEEGGSDKIDSVKNFFWNVKESAQGYIGKVKNKWK